MEFKITYVIEGIVEMARQFPDIVREETRKRMDIVTIRLEKDVVENTPNDSGNLYKSIHGKSVSYGSVVKGIVDTSQPYGEVMEYGRKAGTWPKIGPLELWARRHLSIKDEKEAKSAAYAIARNIFKYGSPTRKGVRIESAHMFEKAWKKDYNWVVDQLQGILEEVMKRVEKLK